VAAPFFFNAHQADELSLFQVTTASVSAVMYILWFLISSFKSLSEILNVATARRPKIEMKTGKATGSLRLAANVLNPSLCLRAPCRGSTSVNDCEVS
jgi:hypothetical protein